VELRQVGKIKSAGGGEEERWPSLAPLHSKLRKVINYSVSDLFCVNSSSREMGAVNLEKKSRLRQRSTIQGLLP